MKFKIQQDIKEAMRAKEEVRLSTLRMLLSAIHNREIEKRARGGEAELSDEEIIAAVRSEAKKRRDAIAEYEKGGRIDLAEKEKGELKILEEYLPQELSDEELEKIARDVVSRLGQVTEKEFGRVMGEVMKQVRGQASGDRVGSIVRKILLP